MQSQFSPSHSRCESGLNKSHFIFLFPFYYTHGIYINKNHGLPFQSDYGKLYKSFFYFYRLPICFITMFTNRISIIYHTSFITITICANIHFSKSRLLKQSKHIPYNLCLSLFTKGVFSSKQYGHIIFLLNHTKLPV